MALITEFANRFHIRPRESHAYLKRFCGLDHLNEYYNVLHTLSFDDSVETMAEVCAHNGGELR